MDVSVKRNNEIVGCVSLKMIASNYAQNNKNYLRNLHGETLNIQRVGISNYCLNILPIAVPYLRKNGTIKKLEKISNTHIEPFVIMDSMSSTNFLEIPKVSCIYVVDLNTDSYIEEHIDKNLRTGECYNTFIQILNPTKANIDTINNLQSEIKDFLNRNSNLNNFFLNIVEDLKNRFPNDFSRNTTLCA